MPLYPRTFLATVAFALLAAAPVLQAQSPAASATPAPSAAPAASPTPDSLSKLTSDLLEDEEKRGKIEGELNAEPPVAAVSAKAAALNKEIGEQLAADSKTLGGTPSLKVIENLEASWQDRSEPHRPGRPLR